MLLLQVKGSLESLLLGRGGDHIGLGDTGREKGFSGLGGGPFAHSESVEGKLRESSSSTEMYCIDTSYNNN